VKILLADDHTMFRQALGFMVKEALPEAEFGEAATLEEALAHVRQEPWDVVLLDINLSGRNGLDVLKELHQTNPKLPVLVLSGYSEDEYALRAIRAGAAGYLSKDRGTYEVIEAVKKVLAGGKFITPSVAEKLATAIAGETGQPGHEALSERERQVMEMIVAGKTMTQIGNELGLSIKTVSTYRKRITEKTGLKSDAELTRYALENKLVS
jgi:DNA-binding NarL/FixJ family response regulator